MKQVFFKTVNALEAAATTAGDARFNDLEKGKLGFWCLDAATGGDWFASALFENRFVIADTDDDDGASTAVSPTVTMVGGNFLKSRIQVVQGYGAANPIASPIIHTSDIVRITCAHYEASTRHAGTVTFASGDSGKEVQIKFIIRKQPTEYTNYVNNEAGIADLSGGNYRFPLVGFNTTNHKAINITAKGTTDNGAGEMVTAIQENAVLNSMFTVSQSSGTLTVTARHAGVIFEMIADNLDDNTKPVVANASAKWAPGTGNDWQARGDELKARAQFGIHNRMYFPTDVTDFVTNDKQYDRFEITYKINGDWGPVKGSQYGSAIIYEETGADPGDDVKDVLNLGTAPTAGTVVEHLFGRSH